MTTDDGPAPPPALTIGVPASTGEDDLPAPLASLWTSAAALGGAVEILVAVNGPDEPAPAPAVAGAERFARDAGVTLVAPDGDVPARGSCARLLRLLARSKTAAWNAIRAAARSPIIVFADGDVRVAPAALPLLVGRLRAEPTLAIVAGREEPLVTADDGLVARIAALPHRQHGFGTYPWRRFFREIAPREYPLVLLSMAARAFARARALRQIRHGFQRGWAVLPSTKRWPAGGGTAG